MQYKYIINTVLYNKCINHLNLGFTVKCPKN